ncbi:hypothetical protein ACSFA7_14100 [Variovorax sp. LT1R20]|uniref:hypothetical protein n=1 Tax=Variovorax sp. LT1R20 TaxID=3443729 RepID=UPI003F488ABC
MDIKHPSALATRCAVAIAFLTFAAIAVAQPATPEIPQQVTLSLDRDLVTFIKVAAWAAGIFLAIFAALAVGFFGFDVRAARKSLLEASDDIRTRSEAIRKDHQSLIELKERLEQLGAKLIDQVEKANPPAPGSTTEPTTSPDRGDTSGAPIGPLSEAWFTEEKKKEIVRNTIASSEFEWSTLDTLHRKTGFSKPELMSLANRDPLVQRGIGRNSEVLFRLKEFNHPLPNNGLGTMTLEDWAKILQQHAQEGKSPIVKGMFPG